MIRPFLLVSLFYFFSDIRNIRLFDHFVMVNDDWGGFAKVHTFGFDNLEFAFIVSRVDHILYFLAKLLTTLCLTVSAITNKYELSVITHIRLQVQS